MKKNRIIPALLILLLCLTGCSSGKEQKMIVMTTQPAEAVQATQEAPEKRPLAFVVQDELVIPGEKLPRAVAEAALEATEAASCVAAGTETVYRYEGFTITVHNGGSDPVYSIYFADETVSTTEGLSIGDSTETVLALYGQPDEEGGYGWIYTDGNTDLILLLSEDAVVGIEYRKAV